MANITVNTHQPDLCQLPLQENLPELIENYYGAIKRTTALHNKISKQPEIDAEMGGYIQGQIDNGNYDKIHDSEPCWKTLTSMTEG